MIKVMLSTGEVSGDIHASFLAAELLKLNPSVKLFGMAGERCRAAGVETLLDLSSKGTVGITEVIRFLPSILLAYFRMRAVMKRERPDLLLLVDYQGFNMLLAHYAKKLGIRTVYYIAPQEWLWGTSKGVKKVASTLDRILAIFEREAEEYKKAGANVSYVGNPNLDTIKLSLDKSAFCRAYSLNPSFPIIGLFPGSRLHEIRGLLPIFLRAVELIRSKVPNAQFLLSVSSGQFSKEIEKLAGPCGLRLVHGKSHDILSAANVSLAASGTITMEGTILGAPMVMAYRISAISEFIGKRLLKVRLPYYSMTNLLVGSEVIPEFVQDKATPQNLAAKAIELLTDKESAARMRAGYAQALKKFGSPGAVKLAAQIVNSELKGKV